MPASVDFRAVRSAARRIKRHVLDTPLLLSRTLSQIHGCEIWLKFENLQFTASFKERGALNKLLQLQPAQLARGVLAVSAGNHAQGVAYHAQRLGARACIVMPLATAHVKVERTRDFGAEVILHGESFDAAREHGVRLAAERAMTFIHPYDDPAVIAGQGTIGIEMLRAAPQLDLLLVPIGGGGLISGVAIAAKALKPRIEVVGVETTSYPAAWAALSKRKPRFRHSTVADGIAVRQLGALTLPLIRRHVDDVVLVAESAIEQAIVALLEIEKTVAEGAGAAGLAAIACHPRRFAGKRVGVVLSGGNIDTLLLTQILRRVLARGRRLVRFAIRLPDRPGALARVSAVLGELDANIEAIEHQRTFSSAPLKTPEVEFTVQTRGSAHVRAIVRTLRRAGFAVRPAHDIALP
ncbi:MAG: threonine ammonia-lyase [Burkholderiales bacterium]|nr:threonine ammonia-lyase [Burkholderiales bacterium]